MNDEEENIETYADLRIYGLSKVDYDYFRQIVRNHGNNWASAFKSLLSSYGLSESVGRLIGELEELKMRIQALEEKDRKEVKKTFGGN